MEWGVLAFLAEPWFVVPWYAVGVAGATWVALDSFILNQNVNPALKWAWPVTVLFFSVIGIALYLWTCRPSGIGQFHGDEAAKIHHEYVNNTFRRVTGAAVHCVGGDGLGIMAAMAAARLLDMAVWTEFWFEYVVGFAFGWFIFQYMAMRNTGRGRLTALLLGGRAEFFSIMTVMAGMGVVMVFVTPLVVGEQPKPDTVAFWGFAALGLLFGFVATYPMNWWLVRIGWKPGMA